MGVHKAPSIPRLLTSTMASTLPLPFLRPMSLPRPSTVHKYLNLSRPLLSQTTTIRKASITTSSSPSPSSSTPLSTPPPTTATTSSPPHQGSRNALPHHEVSRDALPPH